MKTKLFINGIQIMLCLILFSFTTLEEAAPQRCNIQEIIENTRSGSLPVKLFFL